jgi:four helix bundle protein
MKENNIKDKSYLFSTRIGKLSKYLQTEKGEFVMSKQVLRSGTSVSAMIHEAEYAESKKDFIHKLKIAQKENNETIYWIKLLADTEYLNAKEFVSIHTDAVEILKILTTIIKNSKGNQNSD